MNDTTMIRDVNGKRREVVIPEGWRQVQVGLVARGDKYLDVVALSAGDTVFKDVDEADVDCRVDGYRLIIRDWPKYLSERGAR